MSSASAQSSLNIPPSLGFCLGEVILVTSCCLHHVWPISLERQKKIIHRAEQLNQDVHDFAPWTDFLRSLHNIDSGLGQGCKILWGERHYITIRTAGSAADADVPRALAWIKAAFAGSRSARGKTKTEYFGFREPTSISKNTSSVDKLKVGV